jgi:hypothetical protein
VTGPTSVTQEKRLPWPERHAVFTGITALLVLHTLLFLGPLQGMTSLKPEAEPYLIGVVQLVYVVPLSIVLVLAGYRKTFKAVAMGALITFVLNAVTCAVFLHRLSDLGK